MKMLLQNLCFKRPTDKLKPGDIDNFIKGGIKAMSAVKYSLTGTKQAVQKKNYLKT
jgi:hypothetical protein